MPDLIRTYSEPAGFTAEALPFLMRREAINNLQIDIVGRMDRGSIEGAFGATLHGASGELTGVATMSVGHGLLLSDASPETIEALCAVLRERELSLPSVLGPTEAARAFARVWCESQGLETRLLTRMGIFVLHELVAPPAAPGRVVVATDEHLPLLIEWLARFREELELTGTAPAPERLASWIEAGNVFFWLLPSSEPASVTTLGRESPHGATINSVYTPPEHRGRGFAANSVAHACKVALGRGKRFCALYSDLDDATSTGLYDRLGFEFAIEVEHLAFESADGAAT